MPSSPQVKFTQWSFSRWHDYQTCPAYAKFKHLDRVREPESPAMKRGNDVHKQAEGYALKRIKEIPEDLKLFKEEFAELRKTHRELIAEQQWAFDADWQPVEWYTKKEGACRVVLDVCKLAPERSLVVDHKTGKMRDYHLEQLSLQALAAFAMAPSLIGRPTQEVQAQLWYLDQGKIVPEPGGEADVPHKVSDVPKLKKLWAQKTKKMLADRSFKPLLSDHCRWCAYRMSKGGPCPVKQ